MTLPFDLLLVTDAALPGWLDATLAAIESAPHGRLAVQVRDTRAGAAELAHLARGLRDATRARGVPLVVNERADVAWLVAADGVHLKESGLEVEDARALLGPRALIGASCHDAAGLARRARADYVVLGPFAEVPGKGAPLGSPTFARLVRGARCPVLALGGIDAERAGAAIAAGAHGVAVSRAVLAATDPARATTDLVAAIDEARLRTGSARPS